jgi:hypothetical protein
MRNLRISFLRRILLKRSNQGGGDGWEMGQMKHAHKFSVGNLEGMSRKMSLPEDNIKLFINE